MSVKAFTWLTRSSETSLLQHSHLNQILATWHFLFCWFSLGKLSSYLWRFWDPCLDGCSPVSATFSPILCLPLCCVDKKVSMPFVPKAEAILLLTDTLFCSPFGFDLQASHHKLTGTFLYLSPSFHLLLFKVSTAGTWFSSNSPWNSNKPAAQWILLEGWMMDGWRDEWKDGWMNE